MMVQILLCSVAAYVFKFSDLDYTKGLKTYNIANGCESIEFDGVEDLKDLERLTITGSLLETLPEGLERLPALESLEFNSNKSLKDFAGLKKLTKLKNLWFHETELTEIPPVIFEMESLEDLKLSYEKLALFPEGLEKLPNLKSLSIENTEITVIPETIAKLTNLTLLSLSYNSLSDISPELWNMTSLQHLDLSSTTIREIPPEIEKLQELRHLNISHNELSSIPPEIGNLANLTILNLNRCRLKELPYELSLLCSLEGLDLSSNSLTAVPVVITTIKTIKVLELGGNNELFRFVNSLAEKDQFKEWYAGYCGKIESFDENNAPCGFFSEARKAARESLKDKMRTDHFYLSNLRELKVLDLPVNTFMQGSLFQKLPIGRKKQLLASEAVYYNRRLKEEQRSIQRNLEKPADFAPEEAHKTSEIENKEEVELLKAPEEQKDDELAKNAIQIASTQSDSDERSLSNKNQIQNSKEDPFSSRGFISSIGEAINNFFSRIIGVFY